MLQPAAHAGTSELPVACCIYAAILSGSYRCLTCWPPPIPTDLTFIETVLLLASSTTFGMASLALKYKRGTLRLIAWLTATVLLGVVFLGFELHDFSAMLAKGGGPGRSGYLSAFFGLVPLHGLHVLGGCIWLLCLVGQIARYGVDTAVKIGIMRLALFWHFLDIVWVAIFSVVYLGGLT
ncbi:cytochrome c oxidase subunit 3 [Paraburkholderia fungorum]